MSNLPLSDELQQLFKEITHGTHASDAPPRAILVQNENGILTLVTSAPPEGSDKDDFTSVLSKLFSSEPSRPGYALYRLDSKSPAGLYEWLNCAYRPESAKVREKMQYTLTQSSLLAGLSEQHFLETVYGGAVGDFSFPRTLRNQRKHDYQNPQQQIRGKSAAEAAGTGTGGARRNFDASAPVAKPSPRESTTSSTAPAATTSSSAISSAPMIKETETTSAPKGEEESDVITEPEQKQEREAFAKGQEEQQQGHKQFMPEPEEVVSTDVSTPPPPPEVVGNSEPPPPPAPQSEREKEARREGEKDIAKGIAKGEGVEVDDATVGKALDQPSDKSDEVEATAAAAAAPAGLAAVASTAAATSTSEPEETKREEKDEAATSIAPSANNLPPPSSTTTPTSAAAAAPATAAPATAAPSSVSRGTGTGAAGLETEREKHLAELKRSEEAERTSSSQGTSSGVKMGFAWVADVEPAIRGLANTVSGTAEWNLVVLTVDLAKEEVQLRQPPRFVPPGDVAAALPLHEPLYAFYRHPDEPEAKGAEGSVGFIYVCPEESSVRQRMLYSTNVIKLVKSVDAMQGLSVVKRLETGDPTELTADVLLENFVKVAADSNGSTQDKPLDRQGFSRPKKPGRR